MWRPLLLFAALLACLSTSAFAVVDRAIVERQFQAWLISDVWPVAKAAKVSRATFDAATAGIALDWTMPDLQPPGTPLVPPKVEWQKEFGSPGAYFDQQSLSRLAAAGRDRLAKWKKALAAIETRYGVPAEIIVAVWAKESGFGTAILPRPAIPALATEAFMGRRAAFFRDELVAALVILQRGDIALANMRSSLGGALGQPQFLPSQFLKYAVDFDGDGRRDIWNSVPDSLASIGRYLSAEGWVKGRGWAVEAKVPDSVACSLEGPEQGQPVAAWTKLGVTRVDDSTLSSDSGLSYLLMPAGRFGPAFIVTDNFYVLKRYNNTDLYALYIGHLADRFARDRAFAGAWGKVGGFNRGEVKGMQTELAAEGYTISEGGGAPDGLIGFRTRIAVGQWQARQGQAQTCFPDAKLIQSIH